MDVKELQEEHGYAGDGTRYDGLRELHFRVWHEDIKAREDSRHEYESKQFDEETGGGTEQEVGLKMSGDGIYKDVNDLEVQIITDAKNRIKAFELAEEIDKKLNKKN